MAAETEDSLDLHSGSKAMRSSLWAAHSMEVTAGCAGAMNEAMSDRARGRDGESARERACVCIFAKIFFLAGSSTGPITMGPILRFLIGFARARPARGRVGVSVHREMGFTLSYFGGLKGSHSHFLVPEKKGRCIIA